MTADNNDLDKKKSHRIRLAGRKAEKKKHKSSDQNVQILTDKQKNPKAFSFNSAVRAERRFRRKQDIETKKQHIPVIDRTPIEPPPILIAVVGPPKVGKSTLIVNLIKSFTKSPLTNIQGPVTIVTGKKRRITIIECNNDINCMIDIAKVADLVLLLCDASFGFEMEIFEFLNICQVHGMPRIMGVLTHLDMLKNSKQLKKTKKTLKHRFWTEVYAGAKLFYLSGIVHGEYLRNEIKNLGRFISVMKFRPLTWRITHSYILGDRYEDLTNPELVRQNNKCDRNISLYGYVRGIPLNKNSSVHIPGAGDYKIHNISFLPDPCPLPDTVKKRSLIEKERLIYAPFSGVGGIVYDKDAVYVELGGSHSHNIERDKNATKKLVTNLIETKKTLDVKIDELELQIFTDGKKIKSKEVDFKLDNSLKWDNESESINDSDSESGSENNDMKVAADLKKYCDSKSNANNDFNVLSSKKDSSKLDKLNMKESDMDLTEHLTNELNQLRNKDFSKLKEETVVDQSGRKRRKVIFSENNSDDKYYNIDNNCEVNSTCTNENSEYISLKTNKNEYIYNKVSSALKLLNDKSKFENRKFNSQEKHNPSISSDIAIKDFQDINSDKKSFVNNENIKCSFKNDSSDDEMSEYSSSDTNSNAIDQTVHCKSQIPVLTGKEVTNKDLSSDDSDKSEPEIISYNENSKAIKKQSDDSNEDTTDSSDLESNLDQSLKWKENLTKKAQDAYIERQQNTENLMKLVYGVFDDRKKKNETNEQVLEEESEKEDIGGLFKMASKHQSKQIEKNVMNLIEISLFTKWDDDARDWLQPESKFLINNCFVTGKWKKSEDAEELLRLDDLDDDSEAFDDFEDLETGEKYTAGDQLKSKKKNISQEEKVENQDEDNSVKELLAEKKQKLKEKFNSEYDNQAEKSFYDELKMEAEKQSHLNKSVFEELPDDVRVQLEGFRPGMYVRIEFQKVPYEFIEHFDPTYPIVIGGLNMAEENIGYVNVKIKKHRWFKRILKTNNPVIISLGWRRFQTIPLYSKLEDDLKYRYLKYTPEHVTCNAHFWGPITPQGTGFLAIQDCTNDSNILQGFRIAATGSVQELDKSTQIMKKLKLVGEPLKIYKKTAFIKGMFSSPLEVAKFEGAKIKTVSGIRGIIKKAVSKPEGSFRASFEDKILLSDIVFCRTWFKVDVPQFYNPVTNLLLQQETKNKWKGMKTTGQLKREHGIKNEPNVDNLYTEIKREPKVFKPLIIPKKLQDALPYRDKPKHKHLPEQEPYKRVAVIREPHEQKVMALMKRLRTTYVAKQNQLKAATSDRVKKHISDLKIAEENLNKKQRAAKKQVCRNKSKTALARMKREEKHSRK